MRRTYIIVEEDIPGRGKLMLEQAIEHEVVEACGQNHQLLVDLWLRMNARLDQACEDGK